MTKDELVTKIAGDAKITKVQARAALESILDGIRKTAKKTGRLSLVGFGSFVKSKRKARMGRNPQTGKEIKIAARTVIRFKAGKALVEFMNK